MTAYAALPAQAGTMHPAQGDHRTWSVQLVHRQTGALHRIKGQPLTLFTRHPAEAAIALLARRDPDLWAARIAPVLPSGRR